MRAAEFIAFAAASLLAVGGLSAVAAAEEATAPAESGHAMPIIESQSWSFDGPFGHFDNAQLKRGYQVYREVCSNCHSMRLLSYRNLGEPGGPEYGKEDVEAFANHVVSLFGPSEDDVAMIAVRRVAVIPGSPVQALAQPALAMMARIDAAFRPRISTS